MAYEAEMMRGINLHDAVMRQIDVARMSHRPPAGGPGPSPRPEVSQEPQPKESPLQREVRELRSRVQELEEQLGSRTETQAPPSELPRFTLSFPSGSTYETQHKPDARKSEYQERRERRRDDMVSDAFIYQSVKLSRSEAEALLRKASPFYLDVAYALNTVYGCFACSGELTLGYTSQEFFKDSHVPNDLIQRRTEAFDHAIDYWTRTGGSRYRAKNFMNAQRKWSDDEINYALNEVYGCRLCSNPGLVSPGSEERHE